MQSLPREVQATIFEQNDYKNMSLVSKYFNKEEAWPQKYRAKYLSRYFTSPGPMPLSTLQKTIRTRIENIFEKLGSCSLVLTEPLRIRGERLPLFADLTAEKNFNLNIHLIITGTDTRVLIDEHELMSTLSQVKAIDFINLDMEVKLEEDEVELGQPDWKENEEVTHFISNLLQRTSAKGLSFGRCKHLEWTFTVLDEESIIKYDSVETLLFQDTDTEGLLEDIEQSQRRYESTDDNRSKKGDIKIAEELSRTFFPSLKQLQRYKDLDLSICVSYNEHDRKSWLIYQYKIYQHNGKNL
jgi:hypothetical protein